MMEFQQQVLVADDDPELLRVLELRLTRIGLAVSTASDGVSAMAKFIKSPPQLLILDIDMPGADGLKVCEHIARRAQAAIPVIILTGRSDDVTIQRCHDLGAHYVTKGNDTWENLQPLISKLLDINQAPTTFVGRSPQLASEQLQPKILLLDDDPHITNAMAVRFQQYKVDTFQAASGVDGYSMALKHHPDIIVTDYAMPDGGADYLILRLQQGTTTRKIPVIMLTGKTFGGESDLALRREMLGRGGVVAFLAKPLDFEALVEEIERFVKLPRANAPAAAVN